ncbi:MAG TPA: sulfite exporter TauE/SafE family protein [Fimbriimonadaceae bacterium]|nr:sulfite exporter TauE/SafE family protein [Fimbriimonadaceae bacterium]
MLWLGLGLLVLFAATLGGFTGFGTAALLLPVLSMVLGTHSAVPTLGLAMVFANASRVVFSWRSIDWKVVLTYSVCAVPASLIGALMFVRFELHWVNLALAIFILLLVPLRRVAARSRIQMRLPYFAPLGAAVGVVSGIGGATGPATAPFILSYGLVGPAYLGTDGFDSTLVHGSKTVMYAINGSLTHRDAVLGVGCGLIMVLGSYLGRRIVDRVAPHAYVNAIEILLVVLGICMLVQAVLK